MSSRSLPNLVILGYCLFFLGGSIGWARNIIAVSHSDFSSIDGMTVIRVIGVPAVPVGAVVGWIPQ